MQLYFIRHGQSTNNWLWDTTGSSDGRVHDPALTEAGLAQAERLARALGQTHTTAAINGYDRQNLAGFGITHLYTSLMIRAVATGTIVARVLGLPLRVWEDLHEEGGMYLTDAQTGERVGLPGHNRAYFETHFPELVLPASLNEAGWWNRPFEEYARASERAERFLGDLLARHGGTEDRVAVISHGGFYNRLLKVIFKVGREDCWFGLNNAAITRIDFNAAEVNLVYLNRVDFLPRELVT